MPTRTNPWVGFLIPLTMATSTSTLLEVCNRVLMNVNERPLANLGSLIGQQVTSAVRSALTELSHAYDWLWLRDRITATGWSGGIASLGSNVQRVEAVSWKSSTQANSRFLELQFVERNVFDLYPTIYYSASQAYRPLRWTYGSAPNEVMVVPYPLDVSGQNELWFYVVLTLSLPPSDDGVFAMPEQYIDLLVSRATATFALSHLDDQQGYQSFMVEYGNLLNNMISRNQSVPNHSFNMYRGSRRYGRS